MSKKKLKPAAPKSYGDVGGVFAKHSPSSEDGDKKLVSKKKLIKKPGIVKKTDSGGKVSMKSRTSSGGGCGCGGSMKKVRYQSGGYIAGATNKTSGATLNDYSPSEQVPTSYPNSVGNMPGVHDNSLTKIPGKASIDTIKGSTSFNINGFFGNILKNKAKSSLAPKYGEDTTDNTKSIDTLNSRIKESQDDANFNSIDASTEPKPSMPSIHTANTGVIKAFRGSAILDDSTDPEDLIEDDYNRRVSNSTSFWNKEQYLGDDIEGSSSKTGFTGDNIKGDETFGPEDGVTRYNPPNSNALYDTFNVAMGYSPGDGDNEFRKAVNFLGTMAQAESSKGRKQSNPNSSADGVFHILYKNGTLDSNGYYRGSSFETAKNRLRNLIGMKSEEFSKYKNITDAVARIEVAKRPAELSHEDQALLAMANLKMQRGTGFDDMVKGNLSGKDLYRERWVTTSDRSQTPTMINKNWDRAKNKEVTESVDRQNARFFNLSDVLSSSDRLSRSGR